VWKIIRAQQSRRNFSITSILIIVGQSISFLDQSATSRFGSNTERLSNTFKIKIKNEVSGTLCVTFASTSRSVGLTQPQTSTGKKVLTILVERLHD
jgi:hypothetical protein